MLSLITAELHTILKKVALCLEVVLSLITAEPSYNTSDNVNSLEVVLSLITAELQLALLKLDLCLEVVLSLITAEQ